MPDLSIMERGGHVYMMTNRTHSTLYVGVTSNLVQRTYRHKTKYYPNSFSARYNLNKLVYFEPFSCIVEAIARDKALKGTNRMKKEKLISIFNPLWKDLSADWYDDIHL